MKIECAVGGKEFSVYYDMATEASQEPCVYCSEKSSEVFTNRITIQEVVDAAGSNILDSPRGRKVAQRARAILGHGQAVCNTCAGVPDDDEEDGA